MHSQYFAQHYLFVTFGSVIAIHHISKYLRSAMLILFTVVATTSSAQTFSFNFHHLTTNNGLSDPVIRSFTRDKYGYIWLGTLNGLNRFNGYEVKIFQHNSNDTFSLPEHMVTSLFCDGDGNLWVGQSKGIYKYDYSKGHFILQPGSNHIQSNKMLQSTNGIIYIATARGLVEFDTKKNTFIYLHANATGVAKTLLSKTVNDFCIGANGNIYITTDIGLVVYNANNKTARNADLKPLQNKAAIRLVMDKENQLWMSYGEDNMLLLKTDTTFTKYKAYTYFKGAENNFTDNRINALFCDNKGRLWITTIRQGLCLYNPAADNFMHYMHDPIQPMSIVSNMTTFVYQDNEGYIWIGTEGYGAEYFHPDNNLFHSIQSSFNQTPTLPDNWCRAAGEDEFGNLWLGTGSGLAKYDLQKNKYTLFQNTAGHPPIIASNSVRSILCNGDDVWIGANGGLNRYHISTGKMDFLTDKDSIPESFFWSIIKDHNNNIWFGTRDGLYKYDATTKKITSLKGNPLLAPYCKRNVLSLYEDSHNRLWIGFYSEGLLMYDAANNTVKYFPKNTTSNSNTAFLDGAVTSVTEDKLGKIWASSLSGLYLCDATAGTVKHYFNNDANISEITSALMCDNNNRLWMASSRGLYVLDSSRKFYKAFDMSDGLPSIDFNNQVALRMHNGNFVYPTLKGFVLFNPDEYRERNNNMNVYISSFKIFGKEYTPPSGIEQMDNISLGYDQSFFSLQMTALNYGNPRQSWYAHKLEPFDKDWVYSKERLVNYTNVPGGNYIFHYKTSTDINNWNVPEKTIAIEVGTVYYKTWWFRLLLVLVLIAAVYGLYKYRIAQKEKLMLLQSKAYSLEKEKALVMYESLKQQLNPHFLFNSLTSLSSLITSNPANAKQFLERMSKIYRYILKSRDNETVPLEDEIKLAEIYIQLQQTRFKEGLQLKVDVPEEYLDRKIAPVTLQNLIENAIKHNIIDVGTPLIIHVTANEDWLTVQNNLQKKNFVESSNKQGLASMQSLYYYLSGKQIIIDETENYFTIKIPLL